MSINPRDIIQRSIGCISFSAIAHSGLIAALLLAPKTGPDIASSLDKQELMDGEGAVEVVASEVEKATPPTVAPVPVPVKAVADAATPAPALPKAKPKLASPVLPKAAIVKKVSLPEKITKVETVTESETAVEQNSEELESLSPVIAADPPREGDAAPPAQVEAADDTNDETTEEAADAVTEAAPEEPSAPSVEEKEPMAGEASIEPQASNEISKPSGPSPSAANAAGQNGQGGGGAVVEASSRRPLAGNPLPQYPRQDRLMKRQGTSIILGDVRRDGRVENVRLERSAGSRDMDSAALSAFKKWKFAPGAEATVRKAFQYALQGPEQVSYTSLKR